MKPINKLLRNMMRSMTYETGSRMHHGKREFKHFDNIRTRSSRIVIGSVVTMDSTDMVVTTLGMVAKGYGKKDLLPG